MENLCTQLPWDYARYVIVFQTVTWVASPTHGVKGSPTNFLYKLSKHTNLSIGDAWINLPNFYAPLYLQHAKL